MVKKIIGGIGILLLIVPVVATSQEEQTAYVYATYFVCDPAMESRADEIIERSYAPHYNAAVEQGNLVSWSWLAHFIGGPWRRVLVLTAPNLDDLLDASGALGEAIEDATPEAGRVFTEVCGEHIDYIWTASSSLGSFTAGEARRGDASFSTYMACDASREDRADELMRETIGPVYQRAVEAGQLGSWAWMTHNVGGEYRRLLTSTAADQKGMMAARAAIETELRDRRNERAYRQFREICSTHDDYMWDIKIENQ